MAFRKRFGVFIAAAAIIFNISGGLAIRLFYFNRNIMTVKRLAAVMHTDIRGESVPCCFPLFLCSAECSIFKLAAFVECIVPDTRYAVRYRHARKADATFEYTASDARYAVRYRHARKAAAFVECIVPDARYAGFYHNAFYSIVILSPRGGGYIFVVNFLHRIILHIPCAGDGQDAVLKRPCQVISAGAAFCRVRKCRHRQQ